MGLHHVGLAVSDLSAARRFYEETAQLEVLPGRTVCPDQPVQPVVSLVLKAPNGCLELMQIAKVTNIKNTIKKLKKMDFWIAGLDADGKGDINDISEIDKLAIIIGSEGKGMRRLTLTHCDFLIKIPISKQVESLNASNAASIIFYLLKI